VPASPGSPIDLSNKDIKLKPDNFKLQLEGRMMWDSDIVDGIHHEGKSGSDLELRDAQLTFVGKLNKSWKTELQFNFDGKDKIVSIADANIKYTGWNDLKLTVGKAKEPFGLEKLTSSSYLTMIEESMATEAFAPSRNVGVNLSSDTDKMLWSLGFYEIDQKNSDHNPYAVTGRLIYTPWHQHDNLLHLGIAGSIRDFDGEKYQIEERAEIHLADKIVTSAKTAADQVNLLGLESAWIKGPFSLQIEYMIADIKAETAANANYTGYYLQGSYFLTGESRSYEKGQFAKITPRAKSGAWELTTRYSVLDAQDNHSGVKANNVTVGVNYYINEQVRLMMNYINTQLTQAVSSDTGNAFSFRLQYDF
jgi:phosphate-selective porin OprO/OprP